MKSSMNQRISLSLALCLCVAWLTANAAKPIVVTEAIPDNAEQGTQFLDVLIKGRGFELGSTVTFFITGTNNPNGVTVHTVNVQDSKNITANISVDDEAIVDFRDIEVSSTSGRKGKGITLFSVKLKGGGPTPDVTPPSQITDFQSFLPISDTIRLGWTSTGDDGNVGTADHYLLLQAEQTDPTACDGLVPFDFDNAVEINAGWTKEAGSGNEIWAEELNSETCYAFSLDVFDEAGNHPGPSFTANTTQATPTSAWQQEVLPTDAYITLLEFDPISMQPVIYAMDSSKGTLFFARSPDDTWAEQVVKRNYNGAINFALNSMTSTFGGVLASNTNKPSYAERQPDESWNVTQVTRDKVRTHSLAYDRFGTATVAFRTQGSDGRRLRLARFNGSSFSFETPEFPDGTPVSSGDWGADLKFHPVTLQPTITFLSEDKQEIRIATYNGTDWSVESLHLGLNFGSDLGVFSFEYGPNDQPIIIFSQALFNQYEYYMRMIRRDSLGNWGPIDLMAIDPDGITIDPDGLVNQNSADLAIASDGMLYVSMHNAGSQVKVGRFCEDSPDYTCTPTIEPITGENVWFWETIFEGNSAGNTSIALFDGTVAIVSKEYFRCDSNSVSVICGSGSP